MGIHQMLLGAAANVKRFVITIGTTFGDGYLSNDAHTSFSGTGSIVDGTTDTSTAPGTGIISGHVDQATTGGGRDFSLGLFRSPGGTGYSVSDLNGVRVYNPSGTLVATYLQGSANFLAGGSFDTWRWGTGSSPPWTSANSGQVWSFEIF